MLTVILQFYAKLLFWLLAMSNAEFFKVCFDGLHTIDAYTYINTRTCYLHLHFLLFGILKSVIYA